MAFVFEINKLPSSAAVAMFQLKSVLKAAGWTVLSSSDATTYTDAGDGITSGGSGAGGLGNAYAWFVVRDPSGPGGRQLCFQRGGSYNIDWRIKYSASAGFSGGTPDATHTPSAADEVYLRGGGSDSAPSFESLFAGSEGTWRCHVVADNSAGARYSFWMACYALSSGNIVQAFILDGLASGSFPTEDTDPVVFYTPGSAYYYYPLIADGLANENYGPWGWLGRGSADGRFVRLVALQMTSTATTLVPSGLGSNPHNGKDDGFPVLYARRAGLSPAGGYKGISSLLRWITSNRSTGDTLGGNSRIVIGAVSLPWPDSNTAPLL